MLRYYSIITIYLLLVIALISFVSNISKLLIFLFVLTLIFIIIVVFGVVNIRFQMFLKSYNYNSKSNNKVAITYDDGPDKVNTVKILDILKKYNAKASFFLIGENIEKHTFIAENIHKQGHIIANHTYYHKNTFPINSKKKIKEEISKTQRILKEITGTENKYFRPPFGVTNPTISRALKNTCLIVIGWNIRTFDTKKNLEKEQILKNIVKKLKAGDIILLHDKTKHICWLTEKILIYLNEKKLQAVTIEELVKIRI